ncbi:acyl-CoA dehydrogenase family protein [Kribbella solani]|uniref:Acyl-[acyl-carrier-protein] dehydrogenase MbtN n=1 Tax=Kribbella solani TaxID=236067 RepID=A0A841DSS4_9ACTN|nr:acyl-CoA dehydrogenase family protein [Kribbella solani]MBB5979935.1 acyl-CoA dehydrogenase [Kribbella solani]MDX3004847.1 acyl-CoA dehydrogenase family protein [Kribbella solani]
MPDSTPRPWMTGEAADLFAMAAAFFDEQIPAHRERWEAQHHVDREFWLRCGELGLLCANIPEQYGGGGGTFLHQATIQEAYARQGDRSWGNAMHSGVVADFIHRYGTEEQRLRWLPKMATGELIGALAMTEPSAGSDLKAIRTRAERGPDGWRLNGSKIFITNGGSADLVIVACSTDPAKGAKGISLLVVETASAPGFGRGQPLNKIGQHGADTNELFFDDVPVPAGNLLGTEGAGFAMLMEKLPQERLIIGITAVTAIELAVALTTEYVKQREAFGAPLFEKQHVRFELAECATLAKVARTFLDDCMRTHLTGGLDLPTSSMCKWWLTDVQCRVIDKCLQLHGGYGYMTEYTIARLYADARAQTIYGGANEIQKELIARSL